MDRNLSALPSSVAATSFVNEIEGFEGAVKSFSLIRTHGCLSLLKIAPRSTERNRFQFSLDAIPSTTNLSKVHRFDSPLNNTAATSNPAEIPGISPSFNLDYELSTERKRVIFIPRRQDIRIGWNISRDSISMARSYFLIIFLLARGF